MRLPKARRSSARSHMSASASSHWPMLRIAWCTRPGPSRACAIAKPAPAVPSRWSAPMCTSRSTISQCPSSAWWSITGRLRCTVTPGVAMGTSTMEWRWWGSPAQVESSMPISSISLQFGCAAPVMNHLRPCTTSWPPSCAMRVCSCVGSDDATSGSLIAKQERMSPLSSGSSQRARCGASAKSCSSSMLPLSGALQLKTSAAQGTRPMVSASGA